MPAREGGRYIKEKGQKPRLVERTVAPGEKPIGPQKPALPSGRGSGKTPKANESAPADVKKES